MTADDFKQPLIGDDEITSEFFIANYRADRYDRDELVRILVGVRERRAELAAFASEVEADLLAQAGERSWVVDGLGEVRVRKQTKRNEWDSEGLTRVLVARALDERILNEDTGEYEASHEAVARVISECARPSWRLTPLRARGIQIDEFCTERDAGWGIELPPRSDP